MRRQKRAKKRQLHSLDDSFKQYCDWEAEFDNKRQSDSIMVSRVMVKAQELEDKAKHKEKVMQLHPATSKYVCFVMV